jgi:hypothetical protein
VKRRKRRKGEREEGEKVRRLMVWVVEWGRKERKDLSLSVSCSCCNETFPDFPQERRPQEMIHSTKDV